MEFSIPKVPLLFSPSSPHISDLLSKPLHKRLQQIHPANHKLLHKLIRLFQLILQASVLLPEHLILISQFYQLLLHVIITINSPQKFSLKLFCLFPFNLCLRSLPFCGIRYQKWLKNSLFKCIRILYTFMKQCKQGYNQKCLYVPVLWNCLYWAMIYVTILASNQSKWKRQMHKRKRTTWNTTLEV